MAVEVFLEEDGGGFGVYSFAAFHFFDSALEAEFAGVLGADAFVFEDNGEASGLVRQFFGQGFFDLFGEAFDFTGADFIGWCREVGFTKFDVIPLGGPASAGVAYK